MTGWFPRQRETPHPLDPSSGGPHWRVGLRCGGPGVLLGCFGALEPLWGPAAVMVQGTRPHRRMDPIVEDPVVEVD